ncbi:acetyl-CoA carboxylase biotin carboxyl carrier protein [Scatolibacter rhodanostii]|uniref:acetyl-CoA carboxylase biotin carboxyl carrier protein n=1 Tax=Scatolibacter rhodanostii TaxID=2014781 RepID=UPI000C079663|nr:acetyl-CoA carboxylase biotin carboxyl carrier protein [Scatolibacter rhodanostii]
MDIKQIEKLAAIMTDANLTSISIKENDTEITLERQSPAASANSFPVPFSANEWRDAASVGIIGQADTVTTIVTDDTTSCQGNLVTSPTVGIFYASPSPDSESFVQIGSKVKKGDILCIVEAMKLMNEITSDFDGTIAEICVGNGQVIEYGQPLFRIV